MSSAAKRAANRLNAARSTGPRTDQGKRRAAQNARRHGLSLPPDADPLSDPEVVVLAKQLSRGEVDTFPLAVQLADQLLRLERIRQAKEHERTRAIVQVQAMSTTATIEVVEEIALAMIARKLLTLDRYEERTRSKLRKLMRRFCTGSADG